jgi:type II secretory pathway predicted ATPase ExeA
MLKLKEVLKDCGRQQVDLARCLGLSKAALAQLVNHGQWPKRLDKVELTGRIQAFLKEAGANDDAVSTALDEVEPLRCSAAAPATPNDDEQECKTMLMQKQVLKPATKKAFGLLRDPFSELESVDEMWVSSDIRYVRESMYQTAVHGGFLAVVGESGAGKSTLRRDLINRLMAEGCGVIVAEPYVLAMEDNDIKGKTLKSTHIAEALMAAVAPELKPKSSPEARFHQLHQCLKTSSAAGNKHCLVIEEAHCLPIPTLKHLKRLRELELGFTKLVSVILIGQPELQVRLSPKNGEVREVAQRIEIAELTPIPAAQLDQFLAFRFGRVSKKLSEVVTADGLQALVERLTVSGPSGPSSLLYPLAIGNLVMAALNLAAELGEPLVTGDVVRGVAHAG